MGGVQGGPLSDVARPLLLSVPPYLGFAYSAICSEKSSPT